MHIPDGFLSAPVWGSLAAASTGSLAIALAKVKKSLEENQIPLLGLSAAFIFAAQMVNFPVGGGTSGHFAGGLLAALLLGPWAGLIVIATVLILQSLVFADGGITALGANIFNLGVLACLGGYGLFKLMRSLLKDRIGLLISSFTAAWLSIVLASAACAVELGLSGIAPMGPALTAMVGVHSIIGIGEGLITAAVVSALNAYKPDVIYFNKVGRTISK